VLDRLADRPGMTLKELAEGFAMTRQGCSKHLAVLEAAHVVVVQSVGKERHHYLNADPIQRMYDRWVSRYARPWARAVAGLRRRVEIKETTMHSPELVIETYIATTPERLWQSLIDPDDTERYYFAGRFDGNPKAGSPYRYVGPDGSVLISGTIVSADPPRELVMTFLPEWAPDAATVPSRATFTIEPRGSVCKLTLRHDRIALDDALAPTYRSGWSQVLASLKTLLETGEPLPALA
jgi:uncharacterized protein YndB with AHSA1/START domain/DNA-binding transcriptional ArsR family regulator